MKQTLLFYRMENRTPLTINFNFKLNTSYYWRVDSNSIVSYTYDEFGNITGANTSVVKGDVWTFKTHNGNAYNPKPRNGATALNAPLQLSWTAGDFAAAPSGTRFISPQPQAAATSLIQHYRDRLTHSTEASRQAHHIRLRIWLATVLLFPETPTTGQSTKLTAPQHGKAPSGDLLPLHTLTSMTSRTTIPG